MSPVQAITFDCAETLLRVRWSPGLFALDCASAIGLNLDPIAARGLYDALYLARRAEYEAVNAARDVDACDAWWRQLTHDWLSRLEVSTDRLENLLRVSQSLLYDAQGAYFQRFDDVIPALEALSEQGVRLAVISNWDYTLPRALACQGLLDRFEIVLASLVEGVEKPDARLFHIAAERLGLPPEAILHIGDHPSDDFEGAIGAGFQALLLDRSATTASPTVARTLMELPARLANGFRD